MYIRTICLILLLLPRPVTAQQNLLPQDTLPDSTFSIRLHEVKVVARENRSATTSSTIGSEAIRHIQPFALPDIMQLLPEGITPVISFRTPRYFTLRHIGPDESTNALGTGISIDGIRLSTNADLLQAPDVSNKFSFASPHAMTGPDTRAISTENIASVEVIRGIPSVRYGDITSGMVVIHTRKEARPYTADIRITPRIKSFNAAKGWQTRHGEIFNFSAGYMRSDPGNNSTDAYHRASWQTGYSRRFNTTGQPLYIEAGTSGYFTRQNETKNSYFIPGEYTKTNGLSMQFHFSGEWTPNLRMLTSLEWQTSATYAQSESQINKHNSSIYMVNTNATEEAEHQGFFLPPQYWQYDRIRSRPLGFTGRLSANLLRSGKGWKSRTTIGSEWNSEGNKGSGKASKIYTPDFPTRPGYDFRDIPFMHHYAVYVEENLHINHRLLIEGGVRLTGITVYGLSFRPVAEPRMNLRYTALYRPGNSGLQAFVLKGGVGLLRKMPTLAYLFSEPGYNNFINFRYRDEESGHQLAVVTTAISRQAGTAALKLPQNVKIEAGFSGVLHGFSFDVTGYYEHLTHGFSTGSVVRPFAYRNYTPVNDKGLQPEYRDGEVFIGNTPVGYTTDTTFSLSTDIGNNLNERKGGVEFTLRSDYIPQLATTFILNGAWIMRNSQRNGLSPNYKPQMTGNKSYPMCGLYDNSTTRTLRQRLNTTLRAVTEIPSIRLTTTIALQTVWIDREQVRATDNSIYMRNSDGIHIEGDIEQDGQHNKYAIPAYYMDTQGSVHRFTPELADDPRYKHMENQIYPSNFLLSSYRPYFLLNLRVSKDIGRHISLSFYANNMANMNPIRFNAANNLNIRTNPSAFFGAEIQIKL